MSNPILPLLVAIIVALPSLGFGRALLPASQQSLTVHLATAASLLGSVLSLVALMTDGPPAELDLPIGPPGIPLHLALDPLSAVYLLVAFLAGGAVIHTAGTSDTGGTPDHIPRIAIVVAGLAFALLAADATALAAGIAIAGGALWSLAETGRARTILLAAVLGASGLLLAAVTTLAPPDTVPWFEAIRAHPLDPSRAAMAMALALAGAGCLAGLAPLHAWLAPAHRVSPASSQALLCGAVPPVAIYALVRIVVDLPGAAPPTWWSLPILLMGAASCLLMGWRSVTDLGIDSALACFSRLLTGLALIGVSLILVAAGADLPNLGSVALAAILLLGVTQGICVTLVMLAAGTARHAAGTRRLDHLGGLIHGMPRTGIAMLAGLFALCFLPPGLGFAVLWLLVQALLAAPRSGGSVLQLLLAGTAAVVALSAALGAACVVRLFGVAFLGRPRSPRTASVSEASRPTLVALLALAVVALLLGAMPGIALRLLADPAIHMLVGTELGSRAGFLGISLGSEAPGYLALPLTALIALCGGTIFWLFRRFGRESRLGPAWHDGFARAPAWQPFGDPLTQSDGAGFVPELPRLPGWRRCFAGFAVLQTRKLHAASLWAVLAVIAVLLTLLSLLTTT